MSHFADTGLQTHSIGELYPWTIVVHSRSGLGHGYCRAENTITGEKQSQFGFGPAPAQSFETAHALAEQSVPRDQTYLNPVSENEE